MWALWMRYQTIWIVELFPQSEYQFYMKILKAFNLNWMNIGLFIFFPKLDILFCFHMKSGIRI
jgi:hypothetical protein